MEAHAQTPAILRRRSIRLPGYDYASAGAYFVTICTKKHTCLFGNIVDGTMHLNEAGKMVQTVWDELPSHYCSIEVDEFAIMPNHIHGIIIIVGAGPCACPDTEPQKNGQPRGVAPTRLSLPDVVHRFKTLTTKRYADGVRQNRWQPFAGTVWQRNYWEHIIRNDEKLHSIREYIHNNPARWELDELYAETQTA